MYFGEREPQLLTFENFFWNWTPSVHVKSGHGFRPIGVLKRFTQLRHSNIKYKFIFYKSSSAPSPLSLLKALANEDTVLLMMFLGRANKWMLCFHAAQTGNICCGHKMFLNKIRNIFSVPDTTFVSATNVARAGKRGNIFVGNNAQCALVCQGLKSKRTINNAKKYPI